ncbi:hypothetical protein O9G_000364 [Rozella allomycis CSF55]|uniref:Uncharacterized protein n=1 Tax=Rozella allomycis (strain CSF55) TaxID=988480 RepID=A0A075AYJ9_ROZAC|nr:hypothetical protein O9G_000364 [Rozella allomycis CSF55]|eukprot:EPZ33589.1 hypothetical protein O9G_000364 [Rozella allomycis CSF55]
MKMRLIQYSIYSNYDGFSSSHTEKMLLSSILTVALTLYSTNVISMLASPVDDSNSQNGINLAAGVARSAHDFDDNSSDHSSDSWTYERITAPPVGAIVAPAPPVDRFPVADKDETGGQDDHTSAAAHDDDNDSLPNSPNPLELAQVDDGGSFNPSLENNENRRDELPPPASAPAAVAGKSGGQDDHSTIKKGIAAVSFLGVVGYLFGGIPELVKQGLVNLSNGESHVATTAASTIVPNVKTVTSPGVTTANSAYTSETTVDAVMSTKPVELPKVSSIVVTGDSTCHVTTEGSTCPGTPSTTVTTTADALPTNNEIAADALPTKTEIKKKLENMEDADIEDIKKKVDEALGEKDSNGNGVNFAEPSPHASFTVKVKDEIRVEDLKEAASEATPDQQIKAWSITQYLNFIGFISVKESVGVFLVILYYSVRGMIPYSFSVSAILKSVKNVKSLKSKTVKKPVVEPLPKEKETSTNAKESLSNNTVVDVEHIKKSIDQVKVKEVEKENIVQEQNENEIVPPNVSVKDTEDFAQVPQDSVAKKEIANKSTVQMDDNNADDNNNGDSNATVVVGGIVAGLGVLGIASFAAYKKHKQSI